MQLFYAPGACSLAVHIALQETGSTFDLAEVDLASHQLQDGTDYLTINCKDYVPALRLDNGAVLTENQVILQYVADQWPDAQLAPPYGTMERYRLMEWLGFIATEIHKGFGPLWNPASPEAARQQAVHQLGRRFGLVADGLRNHTWLTGDRFTIVDAYLYTVLRWTTLHRLSLTDWPHLIEYQERAYDRPAVRAALQAEGLAA